MADLRYAFRRAAREPLQNLVIVLTLALGVGVNAAIFSVVHAALVQPFTYPRSQELVYVQSARHGGDRFAVAPADFLVWRRQAESLESLGAFADFGTLDLTGDGEPERLSCHLVTAGYFEALGVAAAHGRTFVPEEEEAGKDRVVVLSHGLWQRRFASRPGIVGQTLTLDGEERTVVGVMPPGFGGQGGPAELWIPLSFGPHRPADRNSSYLGVVGRLRPGVDLARVRAEMDTISRRLAQEFPATNDGLGATVIPLAEAMTGAIRPTMTLLTAATAFVLLIACVNVSHLLIARGIARRREFSIRSALGATRGRLFRHLVGESMGLALAGGGAGLVLASYLIRLLPDLRGTYVYHYTEVRLNLWVFFLTLGAAVAAGLLIGALSAYRASRPDVVETLASGGRSAMKSGSTHRLQGLLTVCEIALAFVLLTGAGLLIRSLSHLLDADRGFDPSRVLALDLSLPTSHYPDGEDMASFYRGLLARLASVPGAETAAAGNEIPGGGWGIGVRVEGAREDEKEPARFLLVTPDYFRAAGIPLLQGRTFTADDRAGRDPVLILNARAAERLFPGGEPIGMRVSFEDEGHEVVGVVGDVRDPSRDQPESACYLPYYQQPALMRQVGLSSMVVLVRTAGEPRALAAAVRGEIARMDPLLPISKLEPLADRLAAKTLRPRLNALLTSAFAALALTLAALGVFGLMTYTVSQRIPELGIRMVLGARRSAVLGWVMWKGLSLTLLGLAVGLLASFGAARLMEGLVYGVSPLDPWTYLAVFLVLGAVAALTCFLPARRASAVDPAIVLRGE